jgi:hypothetical protein
MNNPPTSASERLAPYILLDELSQPVPIAPGPFVLTGSTEGVLNGELVFRWLPTAALAFEGTCSSDRTNFGDVMLKSQEPLAFEVPAFVTQVVRGGSEIKGIVSDGFDLGDSPFHALRFCLANFPKYIGDPIHYVNNGFDCAAAGRLGMTVDRAWFCLDSILEVDDLRRIARDDAGFVVGHVGEWRPASGQVTGADAVAVLDMLHIWFGLLRGAWTGPLFPQGLADGEVVWRQYAPWKLGNSRAVTTWLPELKMLNLSEMFDGFLARWDDQAWQTPLRYAVAWYVEANAPETGMEARVILAQVALELLARVHIVETQNLRSRASFSALSAAERIRMLLDNLRIPSAVPTYMTHVPMAQLNATDGPEAMTRLRNALVHANEGDRALLRSLNGMPWWECSQLAMHYLELTLLALCGHPGHYTRRAFPGWKGDDEVLVPWV